MANSSQSLPLSTPGTHARLIKNDPASARFSALMNDDYKPLFGPYRNDDEISDFCFGNPQERPSSQLVDIFRDAIIPKTPRYYAYRTNAEPTRQILAKSAAKRYAFESLDPDDVFLTTGNFAGLALALQLVLEPDDNVIYMEPGWFAYRRLILNARGVPKEVRMPLDQLVDDNSDMHAFIEAVDDNTKVIILNQPHNPTGKVYSRSWLEEFSEKLLHISRTRGYPLYVLADEAYSDFVFDEGKHQTIAAIYPYTFLAYTYNKMTLAPSQRVGYFMLSPLMPGREELRGPLLSLQITLTWCFPNAAMMESIPKLETMRDEFDVSVISKRRDRMRDMLEEIGYKLLAEPKGTFYMLFKSPLKDDVEFCRHLARRKVFVLPGALFNTPGCFRICLTANDQMITRCVEGFRESFEMAVRDTRE